VNTYETVFSNGILFEFFLDLVQDLYLKEVKSYKTPSRAASDAEGQVKHWKQPATPAAPALEAESELSAYESQAVEVETAPITSAEGEANGPSTGSIDEWFVVEDQLAEPPRPLH
jgi:F-type H+-transporting ATPase subunit h